MRKIGKRYYAVGPRCPFYHCQSVKELRCRTKNEDVFNIMQFSAPSLRRFYSGRFCCGEFENCSVFLMMLERELSALDEKI